MKMHGKKITGPNIEYIVIPRTTGNIVFKATAVLDNKLFKELVPEPKVKMKTLPGGMQVPNPDDEGYLAQIKDYNRKSFCFMVIQSLKDTEGLEWETVQETNPDSWKNYEEELKEAGFSQSEVNIIELGVMTANSLNEAKLKEARDSFLATLLAQEATPQ